jgi:hypothetical protein
MRKMAATVETIPYDVLAEFGQPSAMVVNRATISA